MIRKALVIVSIALFASAAALSAQVRTDRPNDFGIEFGGKCLLYGLGYQRALSPNFAAEASISYFGGSNSSEVASAFFIGGGAKYYLLKTNASPYVGAGVMYATADTDAGPFNGAGGFYTYITPGFEFRMAERFVFKAGVYFLIADGDLAVWPGLSLGYAF
jgi:hypothetical protein